MTFLRTLIWMATGVCVFMLFRPLVEQLLLRLVTTDSGFP